MRPAASPRSARASHVATLGVVAALLLSWSLAFVASASANPVTVTNDTDPAQFQKFGQRSHWKQPWRSYMDTVPATTLLNAVGINFNVAPKLAPATARLLGDSGFTRARVEIGWGSLDYDDPTKLSDTGRENLVEKLGALRDNGIRPLILLNANHGKPCPVEHVTVNLTAAASKGDTAIHVDLADLGQLVAGRSGITSQGVAAQILFASIEPSGLVHLSQPLSSALPPGPLEVTTLRYEPFRPPDLPGGAPNPRFEPTMNGWLNYVGVVTREAEAVLGSEEFDVEIWNEMSFGSKFLNINGYYEPNLEPEAGEKKKKILFRTVEFLRNPANGVPNIGIGNGFANQQPWWNGTTSPVGLTTIDKHPYSDWDSFPREAPVNGNRPLNGLGEPSGWKDASGKYHDTFTPTYDDFFPEHFLSGIQTETLVHDLSPWNSEIVGVMHGRYTHPDGGDPPSMWITETNLGPGRGPTPGSSMTAADIRHIESKIVLRDLVAYVNKGVTALHFYAANAGELSLIDKAFFSAASANRAAYPGDAVGGETTASVRRLVEAMGGANPIATPRSLSLRELTDYEGNIQFEGNGTAAFPPLYNRDVLAFLPFQVTDNRFVIPIYVMTRNVSKVYGDGSSPTRFDLPPERYAMSIGGIDGDTATVAATDPLSGSSIPVEMLSRGEDDVVVAMRVTDSPRLLTIEDGTSNSGPGEETPDEELVAEDPEAEVPAESEGGSGDEASNGDTKEEGEEEESSSEERPPTIDERGYNEPGLDALDKSSSIRTTRAGENYRHPALRLKGTRELLSTRRMFALAWCGTDCSIEVSGRLLVGRHTYPIKARQRGSSETDRGTPRVVFALSIDAQAAHRAIIAIANRFSRVRVIVTADGGPGVPRSAQRSTRLGMR